METTKQQTYRIVRLYTSNFQRISAEGVEIVPEGNLITLTGGNGEGKSSVLSSILSVLRGKKFIPEQPIHRGADKSETYVDFGEFTAELKISPNTGPRIVVKSKTGIEIKGPQTFLESKSNEILLDLSAFIRKGETPEGRRQQADLLRRMVGIDFTSIDAEKEKAYNERTAINRDVQTATGKLANFPFDAGAPAEEVKVAELMAELQAIQANGLLEVTKAQETNRSNGEIRTSLADSRESISRARADLSSLASEIETIRELLATKLAHYQTGELTLKSSEEQLAIEAPKIEALNDIDVAVINQRTSAASQPLLTKINQADTLNTQVRANRRHEEIKKEIRDKSTAADALTKKIDSLEKEKSEMLSGAKYPLEGLSFNESGILLNGLPLASASTAEQLKAVLAIGFALNPEIRVAIIREGSMFDQNSLKDIEALCEQYDSQVWLEDNRSTNENAFVIEDGSLRN